MLFDDSDLSCLLRFAWFSTVHDEKRFVIGSMGASNFLIRDR